MKLYIVMGEQGCGKSQWIRDNVPHADHVILDRHDMPIRQSEDVAIEMVTPGPLRVVVIDRPIDVVTSSHLDTIFQYVVPANP